MKKKNLQTFDKYSHNLLQIFYKINIAKFV